MLEGYFSILMTGAVEPGLNFIYINALAAKVDAINPEGA